MIDSIINLLKKIKDWQKKDTKSKEKAKERLHLVLMQDRANVSADFLEMMKQEIIEVIKKYIDVDENEIDVRLTNKENSDGTVGTPALYANIPISNVREIKVENKYTGDLNKDKDINCNTDKNDEKIDKNEIKEDVETENKNDDTSSHKKNNQEENTKIEQEAKKDEKEERKQKENKQEELKKDINKKKEEKEKTE